MKKNVSSATLTQAPQHYEKKRRNILATVLNFFKHHQPFLLFEKTSDSNLEEQLKKKESKLYHRYLRDIKSYHLEVFHLGKSDFSAGKGSNLNVTLSLLWESHISESSVRVICVDGKVMGFDQVIVEK